MNLLANLAQTLSNILHIQTVCVKTAPSLTAAEDYVALKIIRFILKVIKYVDINQLDRNGNTALHRAIIENDIEQVKSIIKSQSIMKAKLALFDKNNQGLTPIDLILEEANAKSGKFSDELKQIFLNAQDRDGDTALHKAVSEQDIVKAQSLIQQGANIFLQNDNDMSALELLFHQKQQGIDKNFHELLQILVNTQDLHGNSILHYIASNPDLLTSAKWQDIISPAHFKEFKFFIRTQQAKEIAIKQKMCVDHFSNVNQKNAQGYTALHYAVKALNTPLVHILLDKNADINIKDNQGYNALHHALKLDNLHLVEILLARGADPTIPNPQGFSSLDYMTIQPEYYAHCLKLCHGYNKNDLAISDTQHSTVEPTQPECSSIGENPAQTDDAELKCIGDTNN